jgi:hypothetical protein
MFPTSVPTLLKGGSAASLVSRRSTLSPGPFPIKATRRSGYACKANQTASGSGRWRVIETSLLCPQPWQRILGKGYKGYRQDGCDCILCILSATKAVPRKRRWARRARNAIWSRARRGSKSMEHIANKGVNVKPSQVLRPSEIARLRPSMIKRCPPHQASLISIVSPKLTMDNN